MPSLHKLFLLTGLPIGFAIYCFGFLVLFSCLMDGTFKIFIMSSITALLVSHFVVSMAMPVLKRPTKESEVPYG